MRTICMTALAICGLAAAAGAQEAPTMSAEELQGFIAGNSYTGIVPDTGAEVATAVYGEDGNTVLTMADGSEQAGTYRFEDDAYCTRYDAFRANTENCFRLIDLGDGSALALYTDGRRALILRPVE